MGSVSAESAPKRVFTTLRPMGDYVPSEEVVTILTDLLPNSYRGGKLTMPLLDEYSIAIANGRLPEGFESVEEFEEHVKKIANGTKRRRYDK